MSTRAKVELGLRIKKNCLVKDFFSYRKDIIRKMQPNINRIFEKN